jgi:hypothetical protein
MLSHQGNVSQNYVEIPYQPSVIIKKAKKTTNVVKDAGKKEPLYTIGGDVN